MYADSSSTLAQKPYKPWLQHQPYEVLEPERECTHCHESWPLDNEFWGVDAKNSKGLTTQCKACLYEKAANRRKGKSNPKVVAPPPTEKPCSTCKVVKPLNKQYFNPEPSRPLGFSSQCKSCRNRRAKESGVNKRINRYGKKVVPQAESQVIAA
jgi:hypothetical protein